MIPQIEKPRVTEIRVRMDCNGCVEKIKKALHGITGIYDLYIDFPQQKITIIGWAEPHKIVKAIKKTRKSATICSHSEQSNQPVQEAEAAPEGGKSEGEEKPPQTESASTQAEQPLAEDSLPPLENQQVEKMVAPEPVNEINQSSQLPKVKETEEIHVIYHHPPEYGYRYAYGQYNQRGVGGQWNANPIGSPFGGEAPQPVHVTHSYNMYKPSSYVTEFTYLHSPPGYIHSSRPNHCSPVYYSGNNANGNITSMFSEENPNACSIV